MKKPRISIICGIAAIILAGIVLLFFAFPQKSFNLSEENYGTPEFIDIKKDDFSKLISEKKSFLLFIDQTACITADGLRDIAVRLSEEKSLKIYHIMWQEARDTTLHEKIRYYPSFAVIREGNLVDWLDADSDEDIDRYKEYHSLLSWLDSYILWKDKKEE